MAFTYTLGYQDFLPSYIAATRSLLHDENGVYYTDQELSVWINEARKHACVDSATLRTLLVLSLPATFSQFNFGGVYSITAATPAGTPPYALVSGGGGTATVNTTTVPMLPTVTLGGTYYQAPSVALDYPGMNISAQLVANLAAVLPSAVSLSVAEDNGAYHAAAVTPAVNIVPVGSPASVQDNGAGQLAIITQGSGQNNGVVIQDAAGVITNVTAANVSIFPTNISTIEHVTVIWNAYRYALRPMAFSDFSAALRAWTTAQFMPLAFSVYAASLWIGPIPNTTYSYEIDVVMYPSPLLDFHTLGPIVDRSVMEGVKYFAAYLAKVNQQLPQEAAQFLELYASQMGWSQNRFSTMLTRPYQDNSILE